MVTNSPMVPKCARLFLVLKVPSVWREVKPVLQYQNNLVVEVLAVMVEQVAVGVVEQVAALAVLAAALVVMVLQAAVLAVMVVVKLLLHQVLLICRLLLLDVVRKQNHSSLI